MSTLPHARCWAVVPAAGKGARMEAETPKQYFPLLGKSILEHTLTRLADHPQIAGLVVVIAPDDEYWPAVASRLPPVTVVTGGAERCHSVLNALQSLAMSAAPTDWVLVHDAARPCVHADDITRLIARCEAEPTADGGLLGMAVRDTLKRCDAAGGVMGTVDRSGLWHALTPQMFRLARLRTALETVLAAGVLVTDDAQAIEHIGGAVRIVEGRADNLKVTRPQDLILAELFLRAQLKETL